MTRREFWAVLKTPCGSAGIQEQEQEQDQTCSQTASCALTSSSTAASSQHETVSLSPLRAPAESQACTQSQQGAPSQLSTMTDGGMCVPAAVCLPQGAPQGGAQGVTQGVAHRGVQEVVQGSVQEVFQGQGMRLTQPSKNAVAAAAQTVQAEIEAGKHPLTKARLLIGRLLEPAAVLAMLGFSTHEVLDPELQTQQQQAGTNTQTRAHLSSVDVPKAAKTSTAAVPAGTEAVAAAAGHPVTNDLYAGANHAAQSDQQQALGKRDSGGSLLTLLGLGGVTEGSGGVANRLIQDGLFKEEEARSHVIRQAGIALHVVEALLNAALTQPEVSGFPCLRHLLPPPPPSAQASSFSFHPTPIMILFGAMHDAAVLITLHKLLFM